MKYDDLGLTGELTLNWLTAEFNRLRQKSKMKALGTEGLVLETVDHCENFTSVCLVDSVSQERFIGYAKRNPNCDQSNILRGLTIALSRAMERAAAAGDTGALRFNEPLHSRWSDKRGANLEDFSPVSPVLPDLHIPAPPAVPDIHIPAPPSPWEIQHPMPKDPRCDHLP